MFVSRLKNLFFSKSSKDSKILSLFESGRDSEIIEMIESGLNVQTYEINGSSLLHLACQYGRLTVIKYLINLKCDLEKEDSSGHTPLYYVCRNNNRECLLFLNTVNPSLIFRRDRLGCCPFECISDFQLQEELSPKKISHSSSFNPANPMYLPVFNEEHVRPMMGMLASNIYAHPLKYDEIWSMVENQKSSKVNSQTNK